MSEEDIQKIKESGKEYKKICLKKINKKERINGRILERI